MTSKNNIHNINYFINFIFKYTTTNFILITLFILLFCRKSSRDLLLLPQPYINVLIVCLTFIILLAKQPFYTKHFILTNSLSVWLGDISYVWYLIHWPTIVFVKYLVLLDYFSFTCE
ncbi:unnamed protein product [Meloidogyne enterolobii]|uniref:Uncharacterized protein n=1 Tax=Meloidogyne enterolobii TaxID=390850 RepID=A0ACB0ZJK5_MELEN